MDLETGGHRSMTSGVRILHLQTQLGSRHEIVFCSTSMLSPLHTALASISEV